MGFIDIFRISKIKAENEELRNTVKILEDKMSSIGADEYYQVKEKIESMNSEATVKLNNLNRDIADCNITISRLREEIAALMDKNTKLDKQLRTNTNKLSRSKELYKSIEYAISNFFASDISYSNCKVSWQDYKDADNIAPSVILKLHCMDIKSLRKAYRENEKQIDKLMDQYSSRYTTKANKSIYSLMVIALRAELQNILYNLKYEKLDKSIEDIKNVSSKYLKIAGEGNQSIAGTLTKFIGELEYFFINAVKIEYNYYVKKEQARQEQLAIREQMRQEAEERKALEAERKKIEAEEAKYNAEISKLQESLTADLSDDEVAKLQTRILELQSQLSDVVIKKEEISNLQNGKAGNVYIISNLGSFGENVFKVGMTRRLDPQDRVNELGSASVPFKFDVHSFIFSNDAVGLENKLHELLNNKRLNKVNMRKEFFKVSLDELEEMVTNIEPSAEFNKTMLAEEFRQSQSTDENYTSDLLLETDDDE
ncbi:GIY-YIG nuclease family protein [Lacrimispora sp. NSJ-141]|uniref:GIY-YIG nuclease family protein n=1 Tax=Lientehia hominis TaxID=2897778 RepID=A0AAP2RJS1_9FIRM|nr:GIY-YIG nuclease family protein [Lientehia hominis]MCD2492769.1 GIY-YIG nuclease family protein [Lientehia hominis]